MVGRKKKPRTVETFTHDEAARTNIPTAEFRSVMDRSDQSPVRVAYERRNRDLDPQLVWRGKDEQDWSDLVVQAPPLYIQEKVHPKVLIDDLRRRTDDRRRDREAAAPQGQPDLFADFNGLPDDGARTEFYQHDANWSNRMILGDSLQVMASLAEREGLRGKVQCIYLDPPYGIKFNSNFQWSTTSRDVKDGKAEHISREPEHVKAFRDTWRDGVHSYLTHRVRVLMDEVFGHENFFSQITLKKLSPLGTSGMANVTDYFLWYAKSRPNVKFRPIFDTKAKGAESRYDYVQLPDGSRRKLTKEEEATIESLPDGWQLYCPQGMLSSGYTPTCIYDFILFGTKIDKNRKSWRTNLRGMQSLIRADRLVLHGRLPYYVAFHGDNPLSTMSNIWLDSGSASTSYEKIYVVQTPSRQVQKCILMATDPGDLVLDPTCGAGTTAYVAEQWGRRWITMDTSRVALALARGRIMGARYPYYTLVDSREGKLQKANTERRAPSDASTHGDVRQGFVYQRVPHVTVKSIANNAEVDVIWEKWQETLEPVREDLNARLGCSWEEWQIPREASADWPAEAIETHQRWWKARIARQQEIDASIAANADYEYLYDKPYEDNRTVRVAGPFTVEGLSPHRVLAVDEDDELVGRVAETKADYGSSPALRGDDPGAARDRWRPAGAQGGPHRLRRGHAVARRLHLRRGALHRGSRRRGAGEARRHLRRSGVRHGLAPRPRRRGSRGRRRRVRRAGRLRLQLRGPRLRVQPPRSHPRSSRRA